MKTLRSNRETRGSVLILALWALLLLSTAIFAWAKFIDLKLTITGDQNNGLDARALAHSGVMVALSPQVSRQTPLLQQKFPNDRAYKVQMTGEAGRLNLNWIFAQPATPFPDRIAIFKKYLLLRGLNLQQQNRLVDCVLDWLTPGNVPHLNGAKADGDYRPPGRGQFLSVDELAEVKGSGPLVSQAGWQDDFTIYSDGPIDLQSVSLRVLESLPGIGAPNAQRFIQVREGPDGIDGTADDLIFQNAQQAASYLGLSSLQSQVLSNYVVLENPLVTVRIRSTGQCGNVFRHVEVVAKKGGDQPTILLWKDS